MTPSTEIAKPGRPRGVARRALVWVLVGIVAASAGCASWRGARLYQSGTHALEAGDTDRALADLQRAARLVPEASEVQNHLGLVWLARGDEGRARRAFERAVALDCDNDAAVANLAALDDRLRERAIERVSAPPEGPSPSLD